MSPTRPTALRPRMVRLRVPGVTVRMGEALGEIVDIALGGALLQLGQAVPVGLVETLVLIRGTCVVRTPARVVRCSEEPAGSATAGLWLVAVQFTDRVDVMRTHLARILDTGVPGEAHVIGGLRDRRGANRIPDPACPRCLAHPERVAVVAREAHAIVFRCMACAHTWPVRL